MSVVLIIMTLLLSAVACVSGPEGFPEEPAQVEAPAEDVYDSIGNYIVTGDVQGAIEAFESLNREKPDDPETKNAYVKLLLAAGKLEEAGEMIAGVLRSTPENPGALFNAALLAGFRGHTEERESFLLEVVRLDPGHADAYALLGELYMEQKQYEDARRCFENSIASDRENLVSQSGLAQILYREGDIAGALQRLDRVVEIDPSFSFGWADRAGIKASAGDWEGAEEDYTRATELDPDYYWHYIDRAKLRIRTRRLEAALEDLDRAITLDPEQFYGYILRAGVRDNLDIRPGALEDYTEALERRPDYYYAFEPLALLSFMEKRWEKAEEMCMKAYPYNRERYEFLLLAGICRLRDGRAAKDFLHTQVHRIPREDLLYHVGRVFLEPGYASMAISKIQQEGKTPEGTRALFYLAQYFLIAGSEDTALKYFLEVEERNESGLMETRLAKAERLGIVDIP